MNNSRKSSQGFKQPQQTHCNKYLLEQKSQSLIPQDSSSNITTRRHSQKFKNQCLICQEQKEDLRECLDCQNKFCLLCAILWVKQKNQCPMKCCDYNWNIDLRETSEQKQKRLLLEQENNTNEDTQRNLVQEQVENLQHRLSNNNSRQLQQQYTINLEQTINHVFQTEPNQQNSFEDIMIENRQRRRTSPGHTPRYQYLRDQLHQQENQENVENLNNNIENTTTQSMNNSRTSVNRSSQKSLNRQDSLEIAKRRQKKQKTHHLNQEWIGNTNVNINKNSKKEQQQKSNANVSTYTVSLN